MDDRDPIPISALQHWCYCPRQCGLIHLEQAFEENLFHDRLGLVGKADAVEFESDGSPYPIEYKHGSRHKRGRDPQVARPDRSGRGLKP